MNHKIVVRQSGNSRQSSRHSDFSLVILIDPLPSVFHFRFMREIANYNMDDAVQEWGESGSIFRKVERFRESIVRMRCLHYHEIVGMFV